PHGDGTSRHRGIRETRDVEQGADTEHPRTCGCSATPMVHPARWRLGQVVTPDPGGRPTMPGPTGRPAKALDVRSSGGRPAICRDMRQSPVDTHTTRPGTWFRGRPPRPGLAAGRRPG